jgi:hypothetical protein
MTKQTFLSCCHCLLAVLLLAAEDACSASNEGAEALFQSTGSDPTGAGGQGGVVGFGGSGGDPEPEDAGQGAGGDGGSAGFGGSEKSDATNRDAATGDGAIEAEGGGKRMLPCGEASCDKATQGCCLNITGNVCYDTADDNCFGSKAQCLDSSDCPGQICCGQVSTFGTYNDISCQPTCSGLNQRRLCEPTADKSCPNSGSCTQSPLLPTGYFVCN